MSTPYNVHNDLYRAREAGRATLLDPGASGVIVVGQVDQGICVLRSAGTNTLEAAAKVAVGVVVTIIAQASVTVNSVVLASGESVTFRVTLDNAGARQWVAGAVNTATANAVTRAVAAAGAGLALVSGGADRTATSPTPVASTVDINTGDAPTDAGLIVLFNALKAAGYFTGVWS